VNNFSLEVFTNIELMSNAAGRTVADSSLEAIAQQGKFLIALNGGGTPKRLFELLGTDYRDKIDWSKTHVFWGDERCVAPNDEGSNYGQAQEIFLRNIDIPDTNIHRIKGELMAEEASKDYALVLKHFATPPLDWPRFDLVLLGMGEDGHTASLFPGSEVNISSPTLAVTAHYQGRPANRVTLTPLVFNTARRVLFLVSGEGKSQTLAHVLYDDYQPQQFPAQRIRPTDGELIWMVDKLAAKKI
jgi:6-phosphogluconolactonase